jgi:predicted ATPase
MIEQQLAGLTDNDRRVLEAASVAGLEFSAAAPAGGLGESLGVVEECCAGLARQGRFLQTSGVEEWRDGTAAGRYRFRHGLYQQVVYERMSEGRRMQLHRRIGRRLEQGYGAEAGERAAELARHFERGRDHPRTVRYRRQAGDNALRRCAYREAVEHLSAALTLLANLPETPERIQGELAVLTTLGPALIATRGHAAPEVEHAYMRARALCQEMGDVPHLFRVLRGLSMLYLNRAELQRVRELAEQRLGLAQQQHDPALLLGAHDALGAILYHLGEFAPARVHLEQGIRLFHTQRQQPHAVQDAATDHGVACLSHLAWVLWFLGAPGPALQRSREGIALAHELAHPFSLTQALYWGAQLHQLGQDARGAQERAEAAMAVAAAHGFAQQRAQALLLHGWALVRQGRRDEGIREMREGLDGWDATGARLLRPYYMALLAEAHGQGGQTEEGQRLLSEALATAHRTGERNYEAEIHRLQGELRLAGDRGQQTAAEHCFRQALDVARCQQARSLELRVAMSLGRLWRRQGKRVRARRLLAEIYESFTEEGDEADLVEAKGLLAELS